MNNTVYPQYSSSHALSIVTPSGWNDMSSLPSGRIVAAMMLLRNQVFNAGTPDSDF